MEVDRNGLEVLDREECLRLLDRATLGRVAVTTAALPTVLPVNFRLADDHRIVFRTGEGTKLAAATRNAVVAFEVDDIDPVDHTGWSVVVTGVARPVVDHDDQAALNDLGIARWAPGPDGHLVEVSLDLVSGRRIPPGLPQS
jgi:nitroimidazol reductase NimA-like FMN-containing flavoprotein (pyridoxamine 5'-phosphate oxidase superfamily)